jgi:hypothetical protein
LWLLLLIAAMALVYPAATIIGGTSAYFIDHETSSSNSFIAGVWGDWVETSQADFEAGVLHQVDTSSSPGDVKLKTRISNHSFETTGDWTYEETDSDYNGAQSSDWSTDGSYSCKFSSTARISINTYSQISQEVDFTDLEAIYFDANLWRQGGGFSVSKYKASVMVDGDELWWQECPTTATEYLNQSIDVSAYTGVHTLIFRITCTKSGYFFNDQTNYFDNIKPHYYSSGTIASRVYDTGADGTNWLELSWSEAIEANTDITFEVRASDTLFAKDAAEPAWTDLGAANSPITSGLPSGRYMQWRATLTTSDSAKTPILQEVTVSYSS